MAISFPKLLKGEKCGLRVYLNQLFACRCIRKQKSFFSLAI